MSIIIDNLVEYSGIAENVPGNPKSFIQTSIEKSLILPNTKPNIKQIIKVTADANITNTRIIRTPISTSLEGQILTGWKVIVIGVIVYKIEYVSDDPSQAVHAIHYSVPFSSSIVLHENFVYGTPVIVNAYIEDISSKELDCRSLFASCYLLLIAEAY